jgi:hypothetical protein
MAHSERIGVRGDVSCCKSCKKRTNGLFKSCKIVLYVEGNSESYVKIRRILHRSF